MSKNKTVEQELIITDERTISVDELMGSPHAKILNLEDVLSFLASPDSGKHLALQQYIVVGLIMNNSGDYLTDGENTYPLIKGLPILYPYYLSKHIVSERGIPLQFHEDSKMQYFLLAQIKQHGKINAPPTNLHYQRHLFRMKDFTKECCGTVLDVGCDNVDISAAIFGANCDYIGLDPFSNYESRFRLVGVGEYLPICDNSVDNVVFNTSLDHILDYHRAIKEAKRVLRIGGLLWISTLVWLDNADLQYDAVHFHHFRKYEIYGVLGEFNFKVITQKTYHYKGDSHRYGLYVSAQKA